MKKPHYIDSLSLLTIFREFRGYSFRGFRSDCLAAFTVALLALPQSMAYAMVVGLPPRVAIFSAIFGTIFAAGFGYSRHLIVGPTNTVAILMQTAISHILYTYYRDVSPIERETLAVHIMVVLTCMVGVMQIIAATSRLGRFAQFVSRPVVQGYILGAALMIVASQLVPFLGLPPQTGGGSLYSQFFYAATHLSQVNLWALIIGLSSLSAILLLKRIDRRIPAAALVFAAAGFCAYYFGWGEKVNLVQEYGTFRWVHPSISALPFNFWVISDLLSVAFAIALLGMLEVTSICKTTASKSGQEVSINQEVLGLGMGNFLSSFLGAMPSSGSFSRSMANYEAGASRRIAAILSGVVVAGSVIGIGKAIGYIPLSALSAFLFITAVVLVDTKQIALCFRATRSDRVVLLLTLGCCIAFSLEVAFYIGVLVSVGLYLKKAAVPDVTEFTLGEHRTIRPLSSREKPAKPEIRILDVEGELFFGAVDFFQATLKVFASQEEVKVIILRLKNAHHLDATACLALSQLYDYLREQNKYLILCGVKPQVWEVLERSGLMDEIGRNNLFWSEPHDPIGSTRHAFEQAEQIIQMAFPSAEEATAEKEPVPLIAETETT